MNQPGGDPIAFALALVACVLGAISLGLLIALRHPPQPRRPELGSGTYPIPPAPVPVQQEVRHHDTGRYVATRIMPCPDQPALESKACETCPHRRGRA